MIKVKYSALVEIELEASEHGPGVMPFEKIEKGLMAEDLWMMACGVALRKALTMKAIL